jgi:nucleoside-diphosphate-sugar epimerase
MVKVFLAGASGAIGRPLTAQLVAAGHEVTGMTRFEEKAIRIRAAGADAVLCDAFDPDALEAALAAARPEAVLHELTALPRRYDPRKPELEETNRLRREGTRNLIAAARAAGARRFVAQSVSFMYELAGGTVKDEEAPLMTPPPGAFGDGVRAISDHEAQVAGAEGLEGLVLRYGWFYGPGTYFGEGGSQESDVRRRRSPVVGKGTGLFSFIHVDDAAAATVSALERGGPGIYNVVDDEPAELREWLPVYAEAIGAKPPRRVPAWLVRLVAGRSVTGLAQGLRGASNAKAKRELGWRPRWPSWRQGFREAPR